MQLKETAMAVSDEALVNSCIEEGNLSKLLTLPDTLDDFSEASIVKCVEHIIKTDDDKLKAALKVSKQMLKASVPWGTEGTAAGEDSPFSSWKCYALNKMLQQRFSPQFLQEASRVMTFDCVLRLTKYFHFLLGHCPLPLEGSSPSQSSLPSLEQIVDWLSALLDSHFQQFHLSTDTASLIDALHQSVSLMAQSQVECRVLQGNLKELIQQFQSQQKKSEFGNYCIEVISF